MAAGWERERPEATSETGWWCKGRKGKNTQKKEKLETYMLLVLARYRAILPAESVWDIQLLIWMANSILWGNQVCASMYYANCLQTASVLLRCDLLIIYGEASWKKRLGRRDELSRKRLAVHAWSFAMCVYDERLDGLSMDIYLQPNIAPYEECGKADAAMTLTTGSPAFYLATRLYANRDNFLGYFHDQSEASVYGPWRGTLKSVY